MLQRPCAAHENSSLSTCAEVKQKFWDMLPKHMKAIFVMRQRNRYYSVSLKKSDTNKKQLSKDILYLNVTGFLSFKQRVQLVAQKATRHL